ncbi:MAG: response regulator [Gemmatimonadaceae bacterium]|nr:response regulator [Gemmatimonadaceae bacterium]
MARWALDGRIVDANQAFLDLLGYDRDALVEGEIRWERIAKPSDTARDAELRALLVVDGIAPPYERVFIRRDGSDVPVLVVITTLDAADGVGSLFLLDLSTQRETEARLRASEEAQLQSQKLEALGRLAGGVAHDFNNLLTVIRGNATMLLEQVGETSPLAEEIVEIERAAARATDLTRQLLAYGRRQVLQSQLLDPSAVVMQLMRMLERLLPPTISLSVTPAREVGMIIADRGQLEQVLVNLVLNARDAMQPRGGALVLRLGDADVAEDRMGYPTDGSEPFAIGPEVPPGGYVHLAVSDSGVGMDEATRAKAFDPFFTTKAIGEGTGLGLSTVYGIMQQSNGVVWIDSAIGAGTTVHLLFARAASPTRPMRAAPPSTLVYQGQPRVLLVEDEDGVRALAQRVLERKGYRVTTAQDGDQALTIWREQQGAFEAVVTDVMMPRVSGHELIARLRAERPTLPVLFMSGYAGGQVPPGLLPPDVTALDGSDGQDRRTRFLQKPFTVQALSSMMTELLATAGRLEPVGAGDAPA